MFINKSPEGKNNISGIKISLLRQGMNMSQRELADSMQLLGIDIDKNAIQRIEAGKRFVTDIELLLCFYCNILVLGSFCILGSNV